MVNAETAEFAEKKQKSFTTLLGRGPQTTTGVLHQPLDQQSAIQSADHQANVATVLGIVFGPDGESHLRFSFSTSIETIEAVSIHFVANSNEAASPLRNSIRPSRLAPLIRVSGLVH